MFIKVENEDQYVGSNEYYWHIRDNDVDYLFTEHQLQVAANRAQDNPEDIPDIIELGGYKFLQGFVSGCFCSIITIATIQTIWNFLF